VGRGQDVVYLAGGPSWSGPSPSSCYRINASEPRCASGFSARRARQQAVASDIIPFTVEEIGEFIFLR
jgi:hypothetical protein